MIKIRWTAIVLAALSTASIGRLSAAVPILYFSDLTSGPNTGLGDGKGAGVIVTIWGANLGASQDTSSISIGGLTPAYIYYWKNADGASPGGPANLSQYMNMQEIAFSIPSGLANGATTISVTVGGVTSNTLPFTVRAGHIYFLNSSGSDSNNGSYATPWKNITKATSNGGIGLTVAAGDTLYITGTYSQSGVIALYYPTNGTTNSPIFIDVYPGSALNVSVPTTGSQCLAPWNTPGSTAYYWNVAKMNCATAGPAVAVVKGMRVIGIAATNYSSSLCAWPGESGAISNNNASGVIRVDGNSILGNYIHDYGCSAASHYDHVFYLSNRGGTGVAAYEIGWNVVANTTMNDALHNYDEGLCGDYTGIFKEHDNFILNQAGAGIGVATGFQSTAAACISAPFWFYNNVLVNTGQNSPGGNVQGYNDAISFNSTCGHSCTGGVDSLQSQIYVFNNTVYTFGVSGAGAALGIIHLGTNNGYSGGWYFYNNTLIDTLGNPVWESSYPTDNPLGSSNNNWYEARSGGSFACPTWDTGCVSGNPLFVDPVTMYNFNLQRSSPLLGKGTAGLPIPLTYDFYGNTRPNLIAIGASDASTSGVSGTAALPAAPRGLRLQ